MYSAHSFRTPIKQSPRYKVSYQPKNVKLINITVKKKIRSQSLENNINLFKYLQESNLQKQSILLTLHSIGSQKCIRKTKPSIMSEIDLDKIHQKDQKFKQRRRSCECCECGGLSSFQKQYINYECKVQQIEKERESPMHKFQRSIRKHQIYVMAPYLFAKEVPTEPFENTFTRQNTIKITPIQLLDVIKQEDGIPINSSKILDRTPTKKPSFFESFLEKQKELITNEKSKLRNKQFSSLSYHLLSRNTIKEIKPFKSKLPFIAQTTKSEQYMQLDKYHKKSQNSITQVYIKPFINKYGTKNRLTTLPNLIVQ